MARRRAKVVLPRQGWPVRIRDGMIGENFRVFVGRVNKRGKMEVKVLDYFTCKQP